MELVIVTGFSGAGKTIALKTLEDLGYYCVDNLPVFLISQFAELGIKNQEISKFAVGIDTRSGKDLGKVPGILKELEEKKISFKLIFLEANDQTLIKRFKETRRAHPLARSGRIEDGIRLEREELSELKSRSDIVIDTSNLLTTELRLQLKDILTGSKDHYQNLVVTVMSFGFKYGLPEDADLVFDVRFLPNPYYEDRLKQKTGLSPEVSEYVLENRVADEYLKKLFDLIDFLIPNYITEGKNQLVISIGCTGGKHRSVAVTEIIREHLSQRADILVKSSHRDMNR